MDSKLLTISRAEVADLVASMFEKKATPEELGQMLFEAARSGYYWLIEPLAVSDEIVNYQDPRSGQTALHIAAANKARAAIRALLASGRCDHLLRDAQGRFASELAYTVGNDPALCRLLGIKEAAQAKALGIRLTARPERFAPGSGAVH